LFCCHVGHGFVYTFIHALPSDQRGAVTLFFDGKAQTFQQYPNWYTDESNIPDEIRIVTRLGHTNTITAVTNYAFSSTGHYLILYLGAPYDYVQAPFLKVIDYPGEVVMPGIAKFGFLNAALTTINLNLDVTNEVPGEFNFQNVAYGSMATFPEMYLDIKPGNYQSITFVGYGPPTGIPLYNSNNTFVPQTLTLVVAIGLIGDPSSTFDCKAIYVPLI